MVLNIKRLITPIRVYLSFNVYWFVLGVGKYSVFILFIKALWNCYINKLQFEVFYLVVKGKSKQGVVDYEWK